MTTYKNNIFQLIVITVVLAGLVAAIGIGGVSSVVPVAGIVIVVLGVVGILSILNPSFATMVFVFLLYTNIAVIANKFHGIPFAISATFPLLLVIPFVFDVILKRKPIIITPVLMLMLGFLLVQIIGTLFAFNMSEALENTMTYVIEGVIIYTLIVNVVRTEDKLKWVIGFVFLATVTLAIFPIIQFATNTTNNNYGGMAQIEDEPGFTTRDTLVGSTRQLRYSGAIGEKNRFAQTMFTLMMLALPFLFYRGDGNWRMMGTVAVGFAAFAAILAFSRGAAVGMFGVFVIGVIFRIFSARQVITIVLTTSIMLAAMPQYTERILSLQSIPVLFGLETSSNPEGPDGALEGRLTSMLAAFIVYAEHPVVGVGPSMFKYYVQDVGNRLGIERLDSTRRSHSLYLDILANTGTAGFILFSLLVFTVLRDLYRVTRQQDIHSQFIIVAARGLFLALLTYLAIGFFLHFAYIRYWWTTFAIAHTLVLIARQAKDTYSDEIPAKTRPAPSTLLT